MWLKYDNNPVELKRKSNRKETIVVEDVLKDYDLNNIEIEQQEEYWLLKEKDKHYLVKEYRGDRKELETALQWQNCLSTGEDAACEPIIKTKSGNLYVEKKGKKYYIVSNPEGKPFNSTREEDILSLSGRLGWINANSENFGYQSVTTNKDWLMTFQECWNDLLTFRNHIKETKQANDLEGLFIESFEEYHYLGQKSIQDLVVFCAEGQCERLLLGNFREDNFYIHQDKLRIKDFTKWGLGPNMADLALLLKSYMPRHKWNEKLACDVIKNYLNNRSIKQTEVDMLLAQLRFPGRYWLYAWYYFSEVVDVEVLEAKLKAYLYEKYHRQQCLERIENMLRGE